jgi:aminopeptidase N
MTEARYFERKLDAGGQLDQPGPGHALPGDKPNWPRDRAVDVMHLKLQVALDLEGHTVSGTATHHVAPLNDGTSSFELDAVDMEIVGATVDKQPARFDYDGQKLRVPFGGPRPRGKEVRVAVEFRSRPRIGLYFIEPDEAYPDKPRQVWTQGQDEDHRFWFPCYDHTNDKMTSELIVTVPGDWFALSNGRLLEDKKLKDGTRRFHWHQDRPHSTYLFTLAAGEFSRIDASRNGLTVDYFVEAKDVEDARRSFEHTPEMIALFEEVSGIKYPWAKYSQVVVRDFVFGGMENTSATTMTELILVDRKASLDHTADYLVSHELAHQWWGDLMTCRDWSHGWLNESFATYAEFLWEERKRGTDEYRQYVIANTHDYLEERYRRPIVTNVWNAPIDIFDLHLYEKGALVLHTLRGLLGDDQFFRSIRRYCQDNQERSVITQDLMDAIEAETGKNVEWFFDQYVFRPGHPQFKVSWSWNDDAKLATVSVRQTQSTEDGGTIFRIPLTIDFRVGRNRPQSFQVEVTEKEHTFVFPLAKKPDVCRFDPYNRVLKELDFDKSAAELRLQLREDDDIYYRQLAAAGLGKAGGAEAVEALEAAVMGDRFWGVQAGAAAALGEMKGTAARDALIRCLQVRQPKARRAVVTALGQFTGDEAVLGALTPFANRDRSWFVESEANRAIGKLRLPGSFDMLVRNLKRRSFREIVRVGALDGLAQSRDERAFEPIAEAARYGAPAQSRAAAVRALGSLGQHFESRKKVTAEEIARYLDDPDFRVRIAATTALRTLKDPSQVDALDRMAKRELDGRGVRVAREVAAELRKGTDTPGELRNLRDEFEKLRDENRALRERLDKVEAGAAPRKRA